MGLEASPRRWIARAPGVAAAAKIESLFVFSFFPSETGYEMALINVGKTFLEISPKRAQQFTVGFVFFLKMGSWPWIFNFGLCFVLCFLRVVWKEEPWDPVLSEMWISRFLAKKRNCLPSLSPTFELEGPLTASRYIALKKKKNSMATAWHLSNDLLLRWHCLFLVGQLANDMKSNPNHSMYCCMALINEDIGNVE